MVIYCVCMLAGAYSLELLPALPPDRFFYVCGFVAAALSLAGSLRRVASFMAGFAIMGLAAASQLADRLDPALQGESLFVVGRVDDFVQEHAGSLRFVLRPIRRQDLPARVRLSWFEAAGTPQIGEVWHLEVRLRRPRGYANPAGFDYAGWLFRQRIGATGYVVAGKGSYRIYGEVAAPVSRVRRHVVARIASLLPRDEAAAVLMAVGVGARHRITSDSWDLYAATGTSHLMAVSGLHIGLAAGSTYLFSWLLIACVCRRRNLRDLAVISAIFAALSYAALSGFAVPARRAFLMAFLAGTVVLCRRRIERPTLLAVPAIVIFLAEPLAILSAGFRLSFAAVAILLFIGGQFVATPHVARLPWAGVALTQIKRLGLMQIALLAGLFPLTVLIFDRFTIVAPLINLLVLPVFNFITVPLTLLGIACDGPLQSVGDRLLILAHSSIRAVLWIVSKAGDLPLASVQTATPATVAVVLLPLLHVLLPRGWPGRRLAIIAIAAVIYHRPASPPAACLEYHALDVGQGLAVVLRTSRHNVLFDTGPAFRGGSSSADLVILPFLQSIGVERLDRVVISHADLDHAGGLVAVINGVETGRVMAGEPVSLLGARQNICVSGDSWDYDGVRFTVLHPRRGSPWTGNNASCVLEVAVGPHKLLLAGDIESPVERLLVHQASLGRSTVVFVPHHGSRTSSSANLVAATRPALAIVSAGFGNRWGFPKHDVVERWQRSGAEVLNTATSGAISQRICREGGIQPVRRERADAQKYWHDLAPGPG